MVLALALLGLQPWLQAQVPVGVLYNRSTGLPDNEVYDILQARDRSIWLACNLGLYRYNGVSYQSFSNPARKSLSVSYLRQDAEGRIWCCSFFGQVFYIENGRMHLFEPKGKDAVTGAVSNILFDSTDRELYLFTSEAILHYALPEGATGAHQYALKNRLPYATMHPYRDVRGKIWVVSLGNRDDNNELASLLGNKLTSYTIQPGAGNSESNAKGFFEHKDSLYMYDRWTRKIAVFRNGGFHLKSDLVDLPALNNMKVLNGQVYALTRGGAYVLDSALRPSGGQVVAAGLNVSAAMQEREGSLWFSTVDAGVISYPPQLAQRWDNLQAVLGTENITALRRAGSHIVLGANNGAIGAIEIASGKLQSWHRSDVETPVIFLHYDATWHNLIWMTTNINKARLKDRFVFQGQYLSPSIKDIVFLSPDSVAYAAGNEAAMVPSLAQIRNYRRVMVEKRTRALWHNTPNQQLWVATGDGISIFKDTVQVGTLTLEGVPIYATGFARHPEGILICTYNQGVLIADPVTLRCRTFISHADTKESAILQMEPTPYGLFLLGDKGLLQYNFATGKTSQIGPKQGLPQQKINAMSWYQGQLWLATTRGVVRLPSGFGTTPQGPVPLLVKQVFYNNDTLPLQDNYKLAKGGGLLQVVVEYPNHDLFGNFRFRYRWNDDTAYTYMEAVNNQIVLANFPTGVQKLQVEVVNELDEPLATVPALVFNAPPRLYETTWFALAMLVLLAAGVYGVVKLATRRIEKAAAEKLEKEKLKGDLRKSMLTAIKAQMNPHFIFNALNTVQSFMYANNKLEANAYLSKFSNLIRHILDMSSRDTISLQEEIDALTLFLELEQIRFEDTLRCSLEVSPELSPDEIFIPSMIVQPYVENALKHGLLHRLSDRRLSIEMRLASNKKQVLEIVIDDNGVGRKRSAEIQSKRPARHNSFSTAANLTRLDLLNADSDNLIGVRYIDKTNDTGEALGTTVILNISIGAWTQKHRTQQQRPSNG